jgi:hypothetical protein
MEHNVVCLRTHCPCRAHLEVLTPRRSQTNPSKVSKSYKDIIELLAWVFARIRVAAIKAQISTILSVKDTLVDTPEPKEVRRISRTPAISSPLRALGELASGMSQAGKDHLLR